MDINLTREQEEHLEAILTKISLEIKEKGGWIPFSRYMEIALYAPKLGYYSGALEKFGRAGDFITAPEISPFFGQTIVNTILPVLDGLKKNGLPTRILEFGAGTGQLAKTILLELQSRDFKLDEYQIIEISANLIQCQKSLLLECCNTNGIQTHCEWLHNPPQSFIGVMLANEVLDAIPCERVIYHHHAWHYLGVGLRRNGDHEWLDSVIGPKLDQSAVDCFLSNLNSFEEGYITEIHPQAQTWLSSLVQNIRCGLLLLFDYGFPEREYYHPQRQEGTLMAHHRHHAFTEVLKLPGVSDITCHINFSNLLHTLEKNNGELFFTSQASYLLDAGIGDLVLQKADPSKPKQFITVSNGIQKLVSEAEMGELFKVMAFGKDLHTLHLSLQQLPGFGGRNRIY
jgi:SAM-dependent MidA family methyltransferase